MTLRGTGTQAGDTPPPPPAGSGRSAMPAPKMLDLAETRTSIVEPHRAIIPRSIGKSPSAMVAPVGSVVARGASAGVLGPDARGHRNQERERRHEPSHGAMRSGWVYTFARPSRTKPTSVIEKRSAASTASEDGALTALTIGIPATAAFWTISNDARPLTCRTVPLAGTWPAR